jgi:hypothetical protein
MPAITIANNPWSRSATLVAEDPAQEKTSVQHDQGNIPTEIEEHNLLEERWELLGEYEQKFQSAVALLKRELDNDGFVDNFKTLAKPLITAVDECEAALRTRRQQSTWGSKNGKLSFWLR